MTGNAAAPRVPSRAAGDGRPAPPVRLAHLGLGNFFRAHQAAYTALSPDASEWGIAAFTGRRPDLADQLRGQDCLYTLVTRADDGDAYRVVDSVVRAHAAGDHQAWLGYLRSSATAAVTLTVTEAGYRRGTGGGVDQNDPAVQADIAALRTGVASPVRTIPARLVAGLAARRRADAGPIAVIPCDNLPHNATTVRGVVRDVAAAVDPTLAGWIDDSVCFVATMVDRITPRATDADQQAILDATGLSDCCPVVTEPFSEWVLAGEFPAGRPDWPAADAQIVDDVAPFEQRKLWLLNGAHSLLAYAGSVRGHATVAEAIADDTCRAWVEQWWDDAARHLQLPDADNARYRAALVERFANRRIRHRLDQIVADGSQKLPIRVLPVVLLERERGRIALGATRVLAAWVLHLRGMGVPVADADAERIVALAGGELADAVEKLLDHLDPRLGSDASLVAAVLAQAEELARM